MGKQQKNLRAKILRFVERFLEENGYPPTYDEIKDAVGLSSKSHVMYYLKILEKDGLIERTPHSPRGLRLVDMSPAATEVMVEGYVAAGQPLQPAAEPNQGITLAPDIADLAQDLVALEVRGEAMFDDLVGDGDIVIVERQREAKQGQMAVVHLRDRNEVMLKHVYHEGDQVRLQPAHPSFPALYSDVRDVEVQGRVVAIIRRL
jgi:repressor LexA